MSEIVDRRQCLSFHKGKALLQGVALATLLVVAPSATAEDFPSPNLDDLRLMVGCANRHLEKTNIEKTVSALRDAGLNSHFKAALLRVMSPHSPNRGSVQQIESSHPDAGGALLHLGADETLRAKHRVDRTSSDAVRWVTNYYLAQIADGEAGKSCGVTPSTRQWMDGMAFEKFTLRPQINGADFSLLDLQQAELEICAAATNRQPLTPQQMATIVGEDSGRRLALERAARKALSGSSQATLMDELDRIPTDVLAGTGVDTPEGRRVFAILSALYTASVNDPDFAVRLRARLLYVQYKLMAMDVSCAIPPESQQLIESLHADNQ